MLKNSKRLRVVVAILVIVIVGVGFVLNTGVGTLSAIGWSDLVLLCPLGALGTMLATKLVLPQAVVSLTIGILFIIVFGRLFCAWICPVPVIQKIRNLFQKKSNEKENELNNEAENFDTNNAAALNANKTSTQLSAKATPALSADEKTALEACSSDCSSCERNREKIDARHFALGGSLLTAAIFGFPVFCLVCPIGLTFGTILLVIRLFSGGDMTWSLIIIPVILIVELIVFRKWCHKLCPLSAFMSLFAKANKTFQPVIDDAKCVETAQGKPCGVCGRVCEEFIDPRHPERGAHAMNECTRCRVCIDACPSKAITMPFLPKRNRRIEEVSHKAQKEVLLEQEVSTKKEKD